MTVLHKIQTLTGSKNTVQSFVNFDKTSPFRTLRWYRIIVHPRWWRLNGHIFQIQRRRIHFNFAGQQAGKIIQISAMGWYAQRTDNVFEEFAHRKHVQIEPISSDCILCPNVLVGDAIPFRIVGRAYIEIFQICCYCGSQSLLITSGKKKKKFFSLIFHWHRNENSIFKQVCANTHCKYLQHHFLQCRCVSCISFEF